MRFIHAAATLALAALVAPAFAQKAPLAATPPLGWNSWDAYGLTITEPAFRANVTAQKEKLLPAGWVYSVIDEGWFFENPQDRDTPAKLRYAIDAHGRYVPVPARFPSAVPPIAIVGEYSEEARKAGFSADVQVHLQVDQKGIPSHIHVSRPADTSLDEKAIEAVRQYRFKPAMKDGKPVAVELVVNVNFQIQPALKSDAVAPLKLNATIEETSFTPLAAWVHAQGLKFGIHIVRGIPRVSTERNLPIEGSAFHAPDAADQADTCPWDPTNWGVKDNAAGQAWYDSLLRQYAAWGVDFLKVDCISDRPYAPAEINMIRRAIDKTGRPILLSLSPGPTNLSHAAEVSTLSNMWRIADDHWDLWDSGGKPFPQGTKDQFARLDAWHKYARPGTWPDADMLPLGELRPSPGWGDPRTSRLTPDEVLTELTLWSIARSPMIFGGNLTLLDDSMARRLTNPFFLAVSQTSTETAQLVHDDSLIIWRAKLPGNRVALAFFNTGDTPLPVDRTFASIDPALGARPRIAYDIWTLTSRGKKNSLAATIPPHACIFLMLNE